MKRIVFDVPAQTGGALTILKQYYDKAIKDTLNEWIFVISTPKFAETNNVKVLSFPWTKKSWFHRLYFDKFVAHRLVEKYEVDEIISLQNMVINNVKVKQILYLHQPLPFIEKKYGFIENYKFWVYQNLIGHLIYSSLKKADKVIVQTEWMKEACLKKANIAPNRIYIETPKFNIKIEKGYKEENYKNLLYFYPASGLVYKNHKLIVEAAKELKKQGFDNFKIIFTLYGNENKEIIKLKATVEKFNLPIEFIGKITSEEVYEYYSKSILLFPSYVETFGLPLLEARIHNTPILASDCAFSHEILDGYNKVSFFNPFKKGELFEAMKDMLRLK